MKVDEATVREIARLARIKIDGDQAQSLKGELSSILDWVEQLDAVDTTGVAPMSRVVPVQLPQRHDEVRSGSIADDVVANAPFSDNHFFVVPKVVE